MLHICNLEMKWNYVIEFVVFPNLWIQFTILKTFVYLIVWSIPIEYLQIFKMQ